MSANVCPSVCPSICVQVELLAFNNVVKVLRGLKLSEGSGNLFESFLLSSSHDLRSAC